MIFVRFCSNNEIHEKLFSLSVFTEGKIAWKEYINYKYINDFFNKRRDKARGTEPQEKFNHCIIHRQLLQQRTQSHSI